MSANSVANETSSIHQSLMRATANGKLVRGKMFFASSLSVELDCQPKWHEASVTIGTLPQDSVADAVARGAMSVRDLNKSYYLGWNGTGTCVLLLFTRLLHRQCI